jgi:hypothetical protein
MPPSQRQPRLLLARRLRQRAQRPTWAGAEAEPPTAKMPTRRKRGPGAAAAATVSGSEQAAVAVDAAAGTASAAATAAAQSRQKWERLGAQEWAPCLQRKWKGCLRRSSESGGTDWSMESRGLGAACAGLKASGELVIEVVERQHGAAMTAMPLLQQNLASERLGSDYRPLLRRGAICANTGSSQSRRLGWAQRRRWGFSGARLDW